MVYLSNWFRRSRNEYMNSVWIRFWSYHKFNYYIQYNILKIFIYFGGYDYGITCIVRILVTTTQRPLLISCLYRAYKHVFVWRDSFSIAWNITIRNFHVWTDQINQSNRMKCTTPCINNLQTDQARKLLNQQKYYQRKQHFNAKRSYEDLISKAINWSRGRTPLSAQYYLHSISICYHALKQVLGFGSICDCWGLSHLIRNIRKWLKNGPGYRLNIKMSYPV